MLRWLWLSAVVVALDQASKFMAEHSLEYGVPVAVLPSFNLTLAYNRGAAFSFLSDAAGWQRWFFIAVAGFAVVVLVAWLRKLAPAQRWTAVGLALILGGALGNLIDRIWLGHVIDFIQLYYRSFYWPAFNIADSAITVGAGMLIWESLFHHRADKA